MIEHDRPNGERLQMMMETNQVSAADVANMLSVSEETVQGWLRPDAREGDKAIPEDRLTQLRMKLSVNR